MPDVLQKNQWDCPESAELNLWALEFLRRQSIFADKENVGKPLDKLFRSIADIRHTAVHRLRVSAKGIEQFALDAESLVTLLGDLTSLELLTKLRRDTQLTIEELERNKHILSSKLGETLKSIAAERARLDCLEEVAIADMEKEDRDYQLFAGTNLENAMVYTDTATPITTIKNKTSSDMDDTDSVEAYDELT